MNIMKYFKYNEVCGFELINPNFIGPLDEFEHNYELMIDNMADEIRDDVDKQILENLNFLVDKH